MDVIARSSAATCTGHNPAGSLQCQALAFLPPPAEQLLALGKDTSVLSVELRLEKCY